MENRTIKVDFNKISGITFLLMASCFIILLIKAFQIFTININWDEFASLGRVYDFKNGVMEQNLDVIAHA